MTGLQSRITVIPARKTAVKGKTETETQKTRVAAYCRVSTDREEQESSYEVQVKHYTDYINGNPSWKLAGIYADEGISATNTRKREGFNRMIDDSMNGRIDMILTKSISRFARNTMDCLKYVRQLKEKGIPIVFEKENINTMDSKGEVLLTIMASLAQQESESLSRNVQMGIQFRYQKGQVRVNHTNFLGYTRLEKDGPLVVVPEQAAVVRRIFREYLEGLSVQDIRRSLERDGVRTGTGSARWHVSTIQGILSNEKYMGDALLQKTVTKDTLEKKRVRNTGEMPQYYVENSHEPIISKEIFTLVQHETARRAALVNRQEDGRFHKYSGRYALTGTVVCGICGENLRRVLWGPCGRKYPVWRCRSRMENGPCACSLHSVKEEDLQNAVVEAVNSLMPDKDSLMRVFRTNLTKAVEEDSGLEEIDSRLQELQKDIVLKAMSDEDYSEIGEAIRNLKLRRDSLLIDSAGEERKNTRIMNMMDYLEEFSARPIPYSDKLVRLFVDRIRVFNDRIAVVLGNGDSFELLM